MHRDMSPISRFFLDKYLYWCFWPWKKELWTSMMCHLDKTSCSRYSTMAHFGAVAAAAAAAAAVAAGCGVTIPSDTWCHNMATSRIIINTDSAVDFPRLPPSSPRLLVPLVPTSTPPRLRVPPLPPSIDAERPRLPRKHFWSLETSD